MKRFSIILKLSWNCSSGLPFLKMFIKRKLRRMKGCSTLHSTVSKIRRLSKFQKVTENKSWKKKPSNLSTRCCLNLKGKCSNFQMLPGNTSVLFHPGSLVFKDLEKAVDNPEKRMSAKAQPPPFSTNPVILFVGFPL